MNPSAKAPGGFWQEFSSRFKEGVVQFGALISGAGRAIGTSYQEHGLWATAGQVAKGMGMAILEDMLISTASLMDGVNMMFGLYSQQSSVSSKLKQQLTYIEENRIGGISDAYYGAKALTNLANTAIGAVETVIGVNLMAAGFTGEVAGAGATATGIGAAVGIPAMAVSVGVAAAGAVAVGHGISMSYTGLNNFQNNAKKISSNLGSNSENAPKNFYNSIKEAPRYPDGFQAVKNGTTKHPINNQEWFMC